MGGVTWSLWLLIGGSEGWPRAVHDVVPGRRTVGLVIELAGVIFGDSTTITVLDAWLREQVRAAVDGLCLRGHLITESVQPRGGSRVRRLFRAAMKNGFGHLQLLCGVVHRRRGPWPCSHLIVRGHPPDLPGQTSDHTVGVCTVRFINLRRRASEGYRSGLSAPRVVRRKPVFVVVSEGCGRYGRSAQQAEPHLPRGYRTRRARAHRARRQAPPWVFVPFRCT